jgi:YfiH family protein
MIFDQNVLAFVSTKQDKNIAFHVQDDPIVVKQNRKNLALKYGYDDEKLVYMQQTHSCNVKIVDQNSEKLQKDCDALITNCKNLPLMVMVADCIPIMIYDKNKKVVAVVHSGRNGIFLNIVSKTIHKMIETFGCETKDIFVYIAPSICKDCYEVDEKLANIAIKNFGNEFVSKRYINLKGICLNQILSLNISKSNIIIDNYCTKCSGDLYFSYRKEKNSAGRFAAVIMIK